MAFSYVEYVGDGVQTAFSFRFIGDGYGYFRESDIHVFVAGTEVQNWTLTAPNQLSFAQAPAIGARVLIRRIMPKDLPYSIWKRGNDFSPLNTNNSFLQQLYALQELYDGFMTEGFRFNQDLSMGGYRIIDLGDGVLPTDAVNLKQLNDTEGSAGESARQAAISAAEAKASELAAKASEVAAGASEAAAKLSELAATAAENEAKASAGVSKANADASHLSKEAASVSETEAAKSASSAFQSKEIALDAAARAEHWASRIDVDQLNARIDVQDASIGVARNESAAAVAASTTAEANAGTALTVANGIDAKATAAVATANEAKASAESVVGIANAAKTAAEGASAEATAATNLANALGFPNLGIKNEANRALQVFSGENLDSLTSTGFYVVDNSCFNIPLASEWGYLEVLAHAGTWRIQRWTALTNENGREYTRICNGNDNAWKPWVETMKFNRFTFIF